MPSRLTITDLTRMQGTRVCVAGVLPTGECVRPLPPRANLTESWLFRQRPDILKPFSVIELDLIQPAPHQTPPHVEDREVNLHYTYCGDLTLYERYELLHTLTSSHVGSVFGTSLLGDPEHGRWLQQGTGRRSLGTIHVRRTEEVSFEISPAGKGAYRLQFEDEAGEVYRLPVTDLAWRMYLDSLLARHGMTPAAAARTVHDQLRGATDVFLRLGLSRQWERHPDRCYLQINGVDTFPDYLDGRCFADFIERPTPMDVPF